MLKGFTFNRAGFLGTEPEVNQNNLTLRQETQNLKTSGSPKSSIFKFPKKKTVVTILLIGETGSGKTSFMSLLLNLFEGNGPSELQDRHFLDAESGLDKSQSQTTEARLYSLTTIDGIKLQVLDTPGLADTRGSAEDKKHKERIYRAIRDLVETIDGVMIVANGRIERLTVATDYTLNTLATFFPRSIIDNIGIIFTNATPDGTGLNFQKSSLPSELQQAKSWSLDNPLSLHKSFVELVRQNKLSERKKLKRQEALEDNYDDTVESLDQWLAWLDDRCPVPTTAIIELYRRSSLVESRLYAAISHIEGLSILESKLETISSTLSDLGQQLKELKDLKSQESSMVWRLDNTTKYNTICVYPGCRSNCHTQCSLDDGGFLRIGEWCKAFKTLGIPNRLIPFKDSISVKCTVCGHEAWSHRYYQGAHVHGVNEVYVKLIHDLEATKTHEEVLQVNKNGVQRGIEGVKEQIERSRREIPMLVQELNNVSLSPNYAGYIRSALRLFQLRKRHLEAFPNSEKELALVDAAIEAFQAQLCLLRNNEAGRVILQCESIVD